MGMSLIQVGHCYRCVPATGMSLLQVRPCSRSVIAIGRSLLQVGHCYTGIYVLATGTTLLQVGCRYDDDIDDACSIITHDNERAVEVDLQLLSLLTNYAKTQIELICRSIRCYLPRMITCGCKRRTECSYFKYLSVYRQEHIADDYFPCDMITVNALIYNKVNNINLVLHQRIIRTFFN